MTREEQIKQYCAEQGFPYGACSSMSNLKADIATEAIKWADEHPNGSLIKWQTGEPKENGDYLVTTINGTIKVVERMKLAKGSRWLEVDETEVVSWCKLSNINPCNMPTFKIGDIIVENGVIGIVTKINADDRTYTTVGAARMEMNFQFDMCRLATKSEAINISQSLKEYGLYYDIKVNEFKNLH